MKALFIVGLACLLFCGSCVTYSHSESCVSAKKKWKHYNSLQFGSAQAKSLKKKR